MSFLPKGYLVGRTTVMSCIVSPQERDVEVLAHILRNVTLFGERVFADLSKLR